MQEFSSCGNYQFSFIGIFEIERETENPFGYDFNDLVSSEFVIWGKFSINKDSRQTTCSNFMICDKAS